MGSVRNVAPSRRARNVAWPIQVRPGIPCEGVRVERDHGRRAAASPRSEAQHAPPQERQHHAGRRVGRADARVVAERHRVGRAHGRTGSIRSSTVVPSFSGEGSANATFTARIRVSVGRPGSCGLSWRSVTASAISSIAPLPGASRVAVGGDRDRRPHREGARVGLVGLGLDAQPGEVGEGERVVAGLDRLARVHLPRDHGAGDGRHDARLAELRLVARDLGAGRLQAGARDVEVAAGLVEVVRGHDLLAHQALAGARGSARASRISASASATRARASASAARSSSDSSSASSWPSRTACPSSTSTRVNRPPRSAATRTSAPG